MTQPTTRIISRDTAYDWGLPNECASPTDPQPGSSAVELHDAQTGTRRWVADRTMIFRAPDDGRTYSVDYVLGLSETQDGISPWEYQPAEGVVLTEVEQRPRTVTVTEWVPAGTSAPAEETAAPDLDAISARAETVAVGGVYARHSKHWSEEDAAESTECVDDCGACQTDTLARDDVPALLDEVDRLRAKNAELHRDHAEDRDALTEMRATIERYRTRVAELEQQTATATAAAYRQAADEINALPQDYECDPGYGDAANFLRRRADEIDPTTSEEEQP